MAVYKMERKLNEGGYSKVYLISKTSDGQKFAAKMSINDKHAVEHARQEIRILTKIRNKNIIRLIENYEMKNLGIMIVLEYYEYGDLYNLIVNKGPLSLEITRKIIGEILYSIKYIHSKGIIHRDMKLDNVLIFDGEKNENKNL